MPRRQFPRVILPNRFHQQLNLPEQIQTIATKTSPEAHLAMIDRMVAKQFTWYRRVGLTFLPKLLISDLMIDLFFSCHPVLLMWFFGKTED